MNTLMIHRCEDKTLRWHMIHTPLYGETLIWYIQWHMNPLIFHCNDTWETLIWYTQWHMDPLICHCNNTWETLILYIQWHMNPLIWYNRHLNPLIWHMIQKHLNHIKGSMCHCLYHIKVSHVSLQWHIKGSMCHCVYHIKVSHVSLQWMI